MSKRAILTDLSAETVRARFDYDPVSGLFILKVRTKGMPQAKVGCVIGAKNGKGYISIKVDGKSYLAHRLAWLYVHGHWPLGFLDHKDGNPSNNALENLREVSRSQNCQNAERPMGYNFIKNRPHPKKYQATIWVNNKSKHLGFFLTANEARDAYLAATQKYFGEFSVLNRENAG